MSPLCTRCVLAAASLMMLGAAGIPARAHHSIAAGFDMDQEVEVTGIVTGMEWINPHARMFFDVTGEDGSTVSWTAWYNSANNLRRRGWRGTDLPEGSTITITGYPARDGSPVIYGGDTRLPDGRTLFGGNAPGQR